MLESGLVGVANCIGHGVKVQNDGYAQGDDHHFDPCNELVAQQTREAVKIPAKLMKLL